MQQSELFSRQGSIVMFVVVFDDVCRNNTELSLNWLIERANDSRLNEDLTEEETKYLSQGGTRNAYSAL